MITMGIVGATGYTGVELVRLLLQHPQASIQVVTSDSEAGNRVSDVFPSLGQALTLTFQPHDTPALHDCDLIFLATPHGVAMSMVPALIKSGKVVIDLSADYRIQDLDTWESSYAVKHQSPELIADAVYGLPELNRDQIAHAQLIANPGCYPTAVSLALLPAVRGDLVDNTSIIADAKSGVSGAGRKANIATSFVEANDNFKAYGLTGHRHQPEITQVLNSVSSQPVQLTFVPHLLPMNRGILATVYARIQGTDDLYQFYLDAYHDEPFVEVLAPGVSPQIRSVTGSNQCQISITVKPNTGQVVVVSVIDNLIKGAAGQAIQNMNIRYGLEETMGLTTVGFYP